MLMMTSQVVSATAHNYHLSFTQLEQRSNSDTITILVRVFADDLTRALQARYGRPVKLSQRILFSQYLHECLEIKGSDGKNKRFVIEKIAQQTDVVLINFTVKIPTGLHGLQLRQTILCELFDDQVNQVLLKFPDREATLEFKHGEGFKVIN
jgi:hypothetical protein